MVTMRLECNRVDYGISFESSGYLKLLLLLDVSHLLDYLRFVLLKLRPTSIIVINGITFCFGLRRFLFAFFFIVFLFLCLLRFFLLSDADEIFSAILNLEQLNHASTYII